MATTVRQSIMTNIKAQLQKILVTNGYQTNVGSSVFEWREYPESISDHPCLIIRDRDCDTNETDRLTHDNRLIVEIGIQASGSTSPVDVRKVLGDVFTACGVDLSWGGYAYWTEPVGDSTEMNHDTEYFIGTNVVKIAVLYRTKAWDHYTVMKI